MTPADYDSFCEIVLGFAELKGKQLSAPALELYWRAMQDWPIDEFRSAANHLLKTCDWMPTPKHFEDLRKASRPVASEAWLKARASCSTAYTPRGYVGGTSGDPLIDKAVHVLGGYGVIAMCDLDKLQFLEKRFNEAYESMQDAQDVRVSLPHLGNGGIGLAEINKRLEERNKIKLLQGKPAA